MFRLPLNTHELKPVKFHPYISSVRNRILEVECGSSKEFSDAYLSLEEELVDLFNRNSIKAGTDNKIVFEFDNNGARVCYGFYDWRFSIGLDIERR